MAIKFFSLKSIFADYSRLWSNFFSLTLLQAANFLLPLLTFPYLVRVLGPEKFGLIMFAQAFCNYFNVLTDFGFNLSATREVAVYRHDRNRLVEIFSSVMMIKIALLVAAFVCLAVLVGFVERFKNDWIVYYLSFGVTVGQVFIPIWFFQGMERMRYITCINIVAKSIFTICIFVFIRCENDYVYVPLLNALGFIVAGGISVFVVFSRFQMQIKWQDFKTLHAYFKDSSHFFLSRVAVSIYTSSNAFVLGLFGSNTLVGYYSIAERIYTAIQLMYSPITNTIYPYIAKNKNVKLFKKLFIFIVSSNLLFVGILFVTAPFLVQLVAGHPIGQSEAVLRLFLVVVCLVVPSIMLGYPFLAALGHKNYANYSVVAGASFHLLGLAVLALTGRIGPYSVVVLLFCTESIVLFVRVYGVKKCALWRHN
jgi:PST family polysaccharide transporter